MDLATIHVALTLVSFTALLVSANLSGFLRSIAGTRYWYATLILLALGSVLMALRGHIPNFLSMQLANSMLIFSPACMIISMCKLRDAGSHPHFALALAAIGSIAYTLAAEFSGLRARLIAVSASHLFILSYGVWRLYRLRGVIGPNWMMISWLSVIALLAGVRIFVTASAEDVGENYRQDNRFQAFYMLAILASTFGFSAAFIVEVFHKINKDLETERSHLASSNRAKDMMLRVISHDLRGPLGVMQQLLVALQQKLVGKKTKPDPWIRDVVDGLQRQAGTTYLLLEDLLTWSQKDMGRQSKGRSICNMRQLCIDAIVFHAVEARRKNVSLVLQETMPESRIQVEPTGLSMVLRNLISNALKYSLAGQKIFIEGEVTPTSVLVTITDQGIGLDSETQMGIGEGQRMKSVPGTLGEPGSGIGLMMCRDWLEAAGGNLSIIRCPSQGTRAEIRLPL